MELKFESNLEYQREAIDAVVDLFEGLPPAEEAVEFSLQVESKGLWEDEGEMLVGVGNHILPKDDAILENLKSIQKRNEIKQSEHLVKDYVSDDEEGFPHFSVEMETGTGKTYVYLRTMFELNKKYGYKKFIVVVPSVAIREGTLKNLEITEKHFRDIYDRVPYEYGVYSSKNMSNIRNFATSKEIQILIMNIDAFRKDFESDPDDEKGVLFHRTTEQLSGRSPREFVQATHPIVILDEPQRLDSERSRQAIVSLNPLFTLRYSATHPKDKPLNMVYRLDPVRAYSMRLVKQIAVASVQDDQDFAGAYVKVLEIDSDTSGIRAKIELDAEGANGPRRRRKTIRGGEDLYTLSNERAEYEHGFQVDEINAEQGYVAFNPAGLRLEVGQATGGYNDAIRRIQIRKAIQEHLEKEIQLMDKGIKVLTLFFIDRVASYRKYDDEGNALKGQFAEWFEEEYKALTSEDRYSHGKDIAVEELHDGYFASDRAGGWMDTTGSTLADSDAYSLIMKDKEKLLDPETSLRFIFSHSALREGWDNPNIFQICTLNETGSEMKKRQEIGRGMRLPVNIDGVRVKDEAINKLVVIANESYEDFARKLQTEYEEDFGVTFGTVPKDAFADIVIVGDDGDEELGIERSRIVWDALKNNEFIDEEGKLTDAFSPDEEGFEFHIGDEHQDIVMEVLNRVSDYRIERHITRHTGSKRKKLNKEVYLDPDFRELWKKIGEKTVYSVQFSSDDLIGKCARNIEGMESVQIPKAHFIKANFQVDERGVTTREVVNQRIELDQVYALPDILGYLQRHTILTRKTIAEILTKSRRLSDFKKNPQQFMDRVVDVINREKHILVADGVKYEKIGEHYEMELFERGEMVSYLTNLLESQKSIYNLVEYDSEVERRFAESLNSKEQVKLYMKLPSWFKIETPVGDYNPDWAIVKQDDDTLYLVRETKGTRDFMRLRVSEAIKVRCGEKHFEALDVDYKVVTDASNI